MSTAQSNTSGAGALERLAAMDPSDIRRAWNVMRHEDMKIAQWTLEWAAECANGEVPDIDDGEDEKWWDTYFDDFALTAPETADYREMVQETRMEFDRIFLIVMPNITWSLIDAMKAEHVRRKDVVRLLHEKGDDRDLPMDPSWLDTDWIHVHGQSSSDMTPVMLPKGI